MIVHKLLQEHLSETCPEIHYSRLKAIMDVAYGLQKSNNLSLTAIGRKLSGNIDIKHKIKKVDRLEGNKKLHLELNSLYQGLSQYIFKYINYDNNLPIVVDLCFIKDKYDVQMMSAELASKGRTIPIYRDVFSKDERNGRVKNFLENLKSCLPEDKQVLIIMDAGFGEEWIKEIELQDWFWIVRVRDNKKFRLDESDNWLYQKDIPETKTTRARSYDNAAIMKEHNRKCRIIIKPYSPVQIKTNQNSKSYIHGNKEYKRSAKEPWVLATNLSKEDNNATKIVNYYKKRMQIEESFRDVKSHRYGLGARYAKTTCINRWAVKMLLAAIVQIVYWIIGILAYNQHLQGKFQANTVKNKKVFSYFYLGQLVIEHDMLKKLKFDWRKLPSIVDEELARIW